jgi:hypothetical protein
MLDCVIPPLVDVWKNHTGHDHSFGDYQPVVFFTPHAHTLKSRPAYFTGVHPLADIVCCVGGQGDSGFGPGLLLRFGGSSVAGLGYC